MIEQPILDAQSIPEMFLHRTKLSPELIAYEYQDGDAWVQVDYAEYGQQVTHAALGFQSMGVEKGDGVAVWGDTMPEWSIAALGALAAGGRVAGIYQTSTAEQAAYILGDSRSRVLCVDTLSRLETIAEHRGSLSHLEKIVVWGERPDAAGDLEHFEGLLEIGRSKSANAGGLHELAAKVAPHDPAILIYTSGTTGMPKGVILTHSNLLANVKNVLAGHLYAKGDSVVAFLPMSHVAEFTAFLGRIQGGMTAYFCPDFSKVAQVFQQKRPTLIVGVPRVYEKVHKKIMAGVEAAPPNKRRLFHWAWSLGDRVTKLRAEGKPVPMPLYVQHAIADRLVLSKVRNVLGGRVRAMISGAAPLDPAIADFFNAFGLLTLEAYGLSETSGASHINLPGAYRVGTVGRAIKGVECRIAEDGEVLLRGETIFAGYLNRPEETAEMLDAEGWLHTGDIGEIDEDGYLRITDRKKNLIVTAGGKNVAPAGIETLIKRERIVSQVVVLGDMRPYLVALITLAPEQVENDALTPEQAQERVEKAVENANAQLARYEQVKRFHILDQEFTVETGEMTPTMKIKRNVVAKKYADILEALYQEQQPVAADV